jgi:hypothetical protein
VSDPGGNVIGIKMIDPKEYRRYVDWGSIGERVMVKALRLLPEMVGFQETKPKYQVSLYVSRAHMPFWFASHCWLVVNNKGVVSRWEVLFRKHACPTSWGHLHKNYLPPTVGIEIIPYWMKYLWKGNLIGSIEGGDNSEAQRMVNFIESSYQTYPYRDRYFFLGPNSNTYPQWILSHFPSFKIELPWNSYGKGYKPIL